MHGINGRVHAMSRWLQAGVMVMAVGLLPLGVAAAGDHAAVGKRLADAVAQGELTRTEAQAMMDTLRRVAERDRRQRDARRDTRTMTDAEREVLGQMREQLDEAVRRGEMTREQADKAHRGLRDRMAKRRSSDSDRSSRSRSDRSERSARDADRSSDSDRDSDSSSQSSRDSSRSSQSSRDSSRSSQSSRDSDRESSRSSNSDRSRDAAGSRNADRSRNASRSGNADRSRDAAGSRNSDRSGRSDNRARGQRDIDWGRIAERIEAAVDRGEITRRDAEAMYRVLRAPANDSRR
jgi:polyhydroxyalkanoate synthesis regulator phasin